MGSHAHVYWASMAARVVIRSLKVTWNSKITPSRDRSRWANSISISQWICQCIVKIKDYLACKQSPSFALTIYLKLFTKNVFLLHYFLPSQRQLAPRLALPFEKRVVDGFVGRSDMCWLAKSDMCFWLASRSRSSSMNKQRFLSYWFLLQASPQLIPPEVVPSELFLLEFCSTQVGHWRIRLLVRDRTSSWTEHNPRGLWKLDLCDDNLYKTCILPHLHLLTKFNYKHQDFIFVHFICFIFIQYSIDSAFIADRFTEVVWSIDATADGEIDRSKFWLTSGHKICSIDNPRSWRFYDRWKRHENWQIQCQQN